MRRGEFSLLLSKFKRGRRESQAGSKWEKVHY